MNKQPQKQKQQNQSKVKAKKKFTQEDMLKKEVQAPLIVLDQASKVRTVLRGQFQLNLISALGYANGSIVLNNPAALNMRFHDVMSVMYKKYAVSHADVHFQVMNIGAPGTSVEFYYGASAESSPLAVSPLQKLSTVPSIQYTLLQPATYGNGNSLRLLNPTYDLLRILQLETQTQTVIYTPVGTTPANPLYLRFCAQSFSGNAQTVELSIKLMIDLHITYSDINNEAPAVALAQLLSGSNIELHE